MGNSGCKEKIVAPNHARPIDTAELIENVRAWAHTANAAELPDGRTFLVWSAGQFERSEDMVIAGAVMGRGGRWEKTQVVVDRFEMDGETWIPWCPTVLAADDGSVHVFFAGNARSEYEFVPMPRSIVRASWQAGDDARSGLFHARLRDLRCDEVRRLLPDDSGFNVQGAPLHLKSGGWAVPYDSCPGAHSHFVVLDEKIETYEKRGDIFCPPGSLEPSVVQLEDGRVICYLRFHSEGWRWVDAFAGKELQGHIWRTESDDECRTFSDPVATNLRNPSAGNDIALSRSGRLLITYNDSYALRLPLCVGISDDMGETFRVRDIETGLGEPCYGWPSANYEHNCHGYPKLLQTRDGIWHLFYTHRYECIKHVWFDEGWLEKGRKVVGSGGGQMGNPGS